MARESFYMAKEAYSYGKRVLLYGKRGLFIWLVLCFEPNLACACARDVCLCLCLCVFVYTFVNVFLCAKINRLENTQHSAGETTKRPIHMAKEAYSYGKRVLFIWQKRPIHMAKEAYA